MEHAVAYAQHNKNLSIVCTFVRVILNAVEDNVCGHSNNGMLLFRCKCIIQMERVCIKLSLELKGRQFIKLGNLGETYMNLDEKSYTYIIRYVIT